MSIMHPLMKQREGRLINQRLQNKMKQEGFDYLILQEPKNIFYITGYLPLVGVSIAVLPAEGDPTLVISTLESYDAKCVTDNVEIKEFLSWVFIDNGTRECYQDKGDIMDPDDPIRLALETVDLKNLSGKVGYEQPTISRSLYVGLTTRIPEEKLSDCSMVLKTARMRKTPWEIKMVKTAAQSLEKVYEATARELKPGMPEGLIQKYFVQYSAEFDDLGILGRKHGLIPAVGPYYGLCGMPRGYTLKAGDVIKFDVGFDYFGFNSDIARTYAVGGVASDEVCEIYDTLYKANRLAVSKLKPGVKCSEIYKTAREYVENSRLIKHYPRGHVGHSVGCDSSAEEYPTLSPQSDIVLEAGMTFSLETPYSATYGAPVLGGFNIEDTFVITEDGHEAFTEMPDNIFGKKRTGGEYVPPVRVNDYLAGKTLVDTPDDSYIVLEDMIRGKKTALYILRFYGCKLTRYEIDLLKREYDKIIGKGAQVIVAVQSSRAVMLQEITDHPLPFEVICDPKGKLAEKFGIGVADGIEQLSGPKTEEKMKICEERNIVHGYDEGNPNQLPGVVFFDEKGEMVKVIKGTEGGDVPDPDETAAILESL